MAAADRTFLTKWGRLTGQQWILARFNEELNNWWTPGLDAYLERHWPTPEQIEERGRYRVALTGEKDGRMRTAKAIADCARTDGYGPNGPIKPRTTPPATQLNIL